jgi:hypothetical protein
LLISLNVACALLEGPQRPVIPTAVATPLAVNIGGGIPSETVFDPVSSIVPSLDPDIVTLVNSVSQQQLMGYVQTLQSFGTRNAFSVTDSPDSGIGAARLWIFNEFMRVGNGRLRVDFDDFPMNFNDTITDQQNIVATLPGVTGSPDLVVIIAHYDSRPAGLTDGRSRAPGADDNASGVALLLETARLLSSRQWNQTIVMVAAAAEEQGSYGARHFVQDAILNNVNILVAINYDTIGGRIGIPQSVRLFAPDLAESNHGTLARYYDFVGEFYVPTFAVNIVNADDREGRFGDQREFARAGLPTIRLTESVEDPDLLNSPTDVWDLIDYGYLQKITQFNVAVLANAIGAPPMPIPPTIAPMANPGSFILTWVPDPRAAGYAISFRPLDSVEYAPFRFVNANQAGNIVLTGYDPNLTYAVSMAALDENGRISLFSPEFMTQRNQ